MKLSKETLMVLKNYSSIQPNLLLLPGNKISTISTEESLVVYSEIQEQIPEKFGIYDLTEFLGALSLFEDPELEFSDKFIKIKNNKHSIKFFNSPEETLNKPNMNGNIPGLVTKFPSPDISFTLNQENMSIITKTASVFKTSDITIQGDGSKMTLIVGDKKNATANRYELAIGDTELQFSAKIKVSNLKFLPGDYLVEISKKKVSRWTNEGAKVTYFVGLELDSQF